MPKGSAAPRQPQEEDSAAYALLAVEDIKPFRLNPRQDFEEVALAELVTSVKAHGVLQPILVRPQQIERHGRPVYDLIAGERRLRAAQLAGLSHVPAIIKAVPEHKHALGLALVENFCRQDLTPIEAAAALKNLCALGMKQVDLAPLLGISQPRISNLLRLLDLPPSVQDMLHAGAMNTGQALAVMARVAEVKALAGNGTVDVAAIAAAVVRHSVPANVLQQDLPPVVREEASLPPAPATRPTLGGRGRSGRPHGSTGHKTCPVCGAWL